MRFDIDIKTKRKEGNFLYVTFNLRELHINCLQNNVIHHATVKSADKEKKVYIGLTERPEKQGK